MTTESEPVSIPAGSASAVEPAPLLLRAAAVLLVPLCALVAFWPALDNDFVDWDDQVFLKNNYRYRGLDAEHVRWAFTAFHEGHYQPLSWLSYGLDYRIWGMNPTGYHLTNLILHVANALLVYLLASSLLRLAVGAKGPGRPTTAVALGAMIAALSYALHPMRVESVAWATERRDVLSGFFYLLTVLLYVGSCARRADRRPSILVLVLCWLLGGAALLAKVMSVSLPIVLMVLDVYPLRRLSGDPLRWLSKRSRRIWVEKLPLLLAMVGFMVVAYIAGERARSSLTEFGIADRVANMAYGYAFYLYKTAWPVVLLPLYEMPVRMNPAELRYLLSGAAVLVITALLLLLRRKSPGLLAAWVCYVVILLPVIGLVQVGPQIVADRYSYLSCLGWFILLGWLAARLMSRPTGSGESAVRSVIVVTLSLLLAAVLGLKTWKQTLVWRDSETLWSHVVSHDPQCSRALNGFGLVRFQQRRVDEALALFRKAVEIRPRHAEAYVNIGVALKNRGDIAGAVENFHKAIEVYPGYADAIFNLGQIEADAGNIDGAIASYRRVLGAKPDTPEIHNNLGSLLAAKKDMAAAAAHFRKAIKLDPKYADPYGNLGIVLRAQGRLEEAQAVLEHALALKPESPQAHKTLGDVHSLQKRWQRAIDQYQTALRLRPDYAGAHFKLAHALGTTGRLDEAVAHYRRAVELDPQNATFRTRLEQVLRASGPAADSAGAPER